MPTQRALSRVLVANRGEIARRIIQSCNRLGLESVAVYTEVDKHAPYVREASSSQALGGPEAYLSIEKIIAAAKASGADSIHPGYGFLSENALFAEAVTKAQLIFIGPSAEAMRVLGSKTAAKALAQEANVAVSPTLIFSEDPQPSKAEQLRSFAARVGYPVLLKAAAGGGGRGMRLILADSDIATEIDGAQREAIKAFGRSEIFAERYISPARHIEVQIAADRDGNVVALGTRDCSLQRNNQKMIEEAPALSLLAGVSEELCKAACRLAKAAHYTNLGTVEFLYSPDGAFYLLEVNTRLQVEHPVTEMTTGLDLVELQIRIAEGTNLSKLGILSTPQVRGHAVEVRLCAEEFTGDFVTSTGIVHECEVPTNSPHNSIVRADLGVEPCSEVSHHYDSLLGKVIVHAPDRAQAIEALLSVLARTRISGVRNNRALLIHLLKQPIFSSLQHSIQGTVELLPSPEAIRHTEVLAHAIAAALRALTPYSAWASHSTWLSGRSGSLALEFPWVTKSSRGAISSRTTINSGSANVAVTCGSATVSVTYGTHSEQLMLSVEELCATGDATSHAKLRLGDDPTVMEAAIRLDGSLTWVHLAQGSFVLEELASSQANVAHTGAPFGMQVIAQIPGKVAAINVEPGARVVAGQVLLVLDSMKMEHPIKAPGAGVVTTLSVALGAIIQAGVLLAVIEDE